MRLILYPLFMASFAGTGLLLAPAGANAQDESPAIEPYTGEPIYLPEGDPPPPPRVVEPRKDRTENYEDGSVRIERQYARMSDDSFVANGYYKEYYIGGQLFVEGQYELGDATGEWTYYHESGEVAKNVTFKNGAPDGVVELRRPDGTLQERREYVDGKRHGDWIQYAEDGELQLSLRQYDNGLASGEWKSWYPSGEKRQEAAFVDGKREGVAREWYESGEPRALVTYKDGQRDGVSSVWTPTGVKSDKFYRDGKLLSGDVAVDAEADDAESLGDLNAP